MYGRNKCSSSYRSVAFLVLGGLGLAALAVPAIASNEVNVNVSPTTGYYEVNPRTYRAPSNARVGGLPSVPTVSAIPSGGLSQSISSGIEITALKDGKTYSSTINASVRAGASAVKNGAVRCLTSFRCNLAMGAGALGLEALLDGLDWVMDGPGGISESTVGFEEPDTPGNVLFTTAWSLTQYDVFAGVSGGRDWYCRSTAEQWGGGPKYPLCGISNNRCSYCNDGTSGLVEELTPLSESDIITGVNNSYNPHPSDWRWLTGGLDLSAPDVDIEIVDIPSITGAGSPDFIEWHDGTSQGTYSELDFSVSGNPGKQPSISVRETTTATDYDAQGNPTGTTTSTTESTSSLFPPVEPPTDCEFMPTVCRFIEWFTEPDPSPDPDQEIRDLVQVYEDGGREVVVGSDAGSCPPPRTIQLSLVPPVEFSFQPFCDLATAVRFWLLALASFGAAYMTVRSI